MFTRRSTLQVHGVSMVLGDLVVLAEHVKSLADLGRQGFGRFKKVEKFAIVHLQKHS